MNDSRQRDDITRLAHSLFSRGYTHGSTGNISMRTKDGGWLVTPTGSSLGSLDPARIARLDSEGRHVGGDPASKEAGLHLAMYAHRPNSGAIVHLHSTRSVAVSLLADVDPENVMPPLTAYYVMRIGRLPLIPYYPPGDARLADAVGLMAAKHHAVLLANHGPVVAGTDLSAAGDAVEELEATATLFMSLRNERIRTLTPEQVAELERRFPQRA